METIEYSIESYINHHLYFSVYTPRSVQFAFNGDKITLLIGARLDNKINVERGFIILDYLNKAWLS